MGIVKEEPKCELVSSVDVRFLEGKLKTFIESLGLPRHIQRFDEGNELESGQEKAAKDMLNTVLWDWYTYIRDHNTNHKLEKKAWYKKNK